MFVDDIWHLANSINKVQMIIHILVSLLHFHDDMKPTSLYMAPGEDANSGMRL